MAQQPTNTDHPDMDHFDVSMLTKHFSRLERVIESCPVKIYAASYNKHPWPYRLQHVGECSPASFSTSQHRILDSGFKDEGVTNEHVLSEAVRRDATQVVAKDYLAVDGRSREAAQRKTTESIKEFIAHHDPNIHPSAWVPLQPPYADHYRVVADLVEDSHLPHRYMLGGLADRLTTDSEQIAQCESFNRVADPDHERHGLGWGPTPQIVNYIRKNPNALDSIDTSSTSQCIRNGRIMNKRWEQSDFDHIRGKYVDVIGGTAEIWMLIQATHTMSEFSGDASADQSTLFNFQPSDTDGGQSTTGGSSE